MIGKGSAGGRGQLAARRPPGQRLAGDYAVSRAKRRTNAAGAALSRQLYYPFGQVRWASESPLPTSFQYTGQRNDAIIGLLFYNARYYPAASRGTSSAALGQFVQADTIVPNPADPQSLNRYSYAANNPLKYVDPSGHICASPEDPVEEDDCYQQEQEILASTVLIRTKFRTRQAICLNKVCSYVVMVGYSHATIKDDRTLVTHNHFLLDISGGIGSEAFWENWELGDVKVYDADGTQIYEGDPGVTIYQTDAKGHLQTAKLTFSSGIFDSPAEFAGIGDPLPAVGAEVAVIDWMGAEGTTFVKWGTVTNIDPDTEHYPGVLAVDVHVMEGASGGGMYWNGIHVANNWRTGTYRLEDNIIYRTHGALNPFQ